MLTDVITVELMHPILASGSVAVTMHEVLKIVVGVDGSDVTLLLVDTDDDTEVCVPNCVAVG